jgi:hypothetical protein
MLEKKTTNQGLVSWQDSLRITNLYTAGIAGEKFFSAIKERGEFVGSKCNKCGITYLPPRIFCEKCFSELTEYVKVGNEGEVVSYTIGYQDSQGRLLKKPIVIGAIRLDGVSTVFIHFLKINPKSVHIGMRVKAVFVGKKSRKGSILDVFGFTEIK